MILTLWTQNSRKTPHSSPVRVSYVLSFMSFFGEKWLPYWGWTVVSFLLTWGRWSHTNDLNLQTSRCGWYWFVISHYQHTGQCFPIIFLNNSVMQSTWITHHHIGGVDFSIIIDYHITIPHVMQKIAIQSPIKLLWLWTDFINCARCCNISIRFHLRCQCCWGDNKWWGSNCK